MFFNYRKNNHLLIILIAFVSFFIIISLLAFFSPSKFFSSQTSEGISLVRDDQELGVFFDRISYYYYDGIPYKYSRIEYPPLAVLYLTVPAFFADTEIGYQHGLIIQNLLFGLVLIYITIKLLGELSRGNKTLWLFVLPSFVYMLANRFDIFPAVLTQLALLLLFNKKFKWSFIVLSLAFLAKGYALILFPIFFIYYLNQRQKSTISLFKNKPLLTFFVPILTITLVIILLAGFANALFPYVFQSARNFAYGSVYLIYILALKPVLPVWLWEGGILLAAKFLMLLQILLPLAVYIGYVFFKKFIKTREDVIQWSLLVLLLYVMFSIYYSPQWFVWLLPLLVLVKVSTKDIIVVIAYDILNYLFFPIAFNYFSYTSLGFDIIVLIRTVLLVWLIVIIGRKMLANSSSYQKMKIEGAMPV